MRSRNAIMTSGRNSPTVPHPVLPFRKTPHDGNGPTPPLGLSFYPRKITEDTSQEWWWRIQNLTCICAVDGGPGLSATRTFTLTRRTSSPTPTIPTVKDLNLPGFSRADEQADPLVGAFNYSGSVAETGWNADPLSVLSFSVSLRLFPIGDAGGPFEDMDTHAHWYRGDNSLLPAILISFDVLLTTPGTEATCFGGSYPDDPDEGDPSLASLLPAHGGGDVALWNNLGSPLIVDLTISPLSWFGRDFNGARPVWNTVNGAQLLPVFQVPL